MEPYITLNRVPSDKFFWITQMVVQPNSLSQPFCPKQGFGLMKKILVGSSFGASLVMD